ncbi:hypothetical protein A2U01_0076495, partial [Trifolium medium]|nr:hypothetical protein [Trifolium medium]
ELIVCTSTAGSALNMLGAGAVSVTNTSVSAVEGIRSAIATNGIEGKVVTVPKKRMRTVLTKMLQWSKS